MPKCNRCTDPFELWTWKKVNDKWKLHNPYSGKPHVCKDDVKGEISSDNSIKPYKKREWKVGDYRSGCDAVKETDSHYLCNKCGDELGMKSFGLEGISNEDELLAQKQMLGDNYHCDCIRHLNKTICKRFCYTCNREAQSYTCTSTPKL